MQGVTSNFIKNNISFGNRYRQLFASDGGENDGTKGSGNIYTNNCFGNEFSEFIIWGANRYSTYINWEHAYCGSSGCTNSIKSDPQLTDPSKYDFSLK